MLNGQIAHSYLENLCTLLIPRPPALNQSSKLHQPAAAAASSSAGDDLRMVAGSGVVEAEALHVDRIRNCDIFVDAHDLYFYADVKLYKFHSRRTFDLRELKTLLIKFNTTENHYQICLRCLPLSGGAQQGPGGERGGGGGTGDAAKQWSGRKDYIATFLRLPTLTNAVSARLPDKEHLVQEWKLKRITDQCQLQLDGHERTYKLTNNFGYGYGSEYSGPLHPSELERATFRISEPHRMSPIQRRQERVVDEMKRFSREQYKINYMDPQVPSGYQNPLRYKPKIYETSMTQEQAHLLHNISRERTREQQPCEVFRQNEIDCGLISILLAICYDVRTTNNEPTCESGWTRSILCPLYCYFEQFDNYRDVLVAFLRRMITYPLCRNYILGRLCVQDAIDVLKGGRNWLINQLLLTHQQFASSDPSRDSFNSYYLEDYILYVTSPSACSDEHMRLLARNLKNVLMDLNQQHLGLGVIEIETELMQEMGIDMGSEGSSPQQHGHGDDDLEFVNDTSGQEDENTTDDDSVITDSFDSMDMDMRLIENEIVYEDDEEDEDGDEDDDEDGDGADEDDGGSRSSTTTSSEAEGNSVIEQCSNSETAASSSTK